jgi:hypothetical protein
MTPACTSAPVWELVTVVNGSVAHMARRIEHRSPSVWHAETVYTTLVDPAFLTARLAELGGRNAILADHHRVGPNGRVSYRLRQGVDAQHLPSAIRTLLGGNLTVDRTETWRPEPAGGYAGTVAVTIPGMPGELGGTTALTDTASGSTLYLDGSVSIPIPLVGGLIEETVAEQITKLLDREHAFAEKWLATHQA